MLEMHGPKQTIPLKSTGSGSSCGSRDKAGKDPLKKALRAAIAKPALASTKWTTCNNNDCKYYPRPIATVTKTN
eukprot:2447252-Amphidinium_carterae.1